MPAASMRALAKIMRVDNRVVSLTIRARDAADDAVLLLLYGQKTVSRENDSVTGGEVMEGFTATGGTSIGSR